MQQYFKLSIKLPISILLLTGLIIFGSINPAKATPWAYPNEISIAEAYNSVFGTSYDTTSQEGLADLVTDYGGTMQSSWTASELPSLTVLVDDTSSTKHLFLNVGATSLDIYNPGPWTAPSRGWQDDPINPLNVINISDLLAANSLASNSIFTLSVGNNVLDGTDTYLINGTRTDEFFLTYNGGGLLGGDKDANEPIIWVSNPNSSNNSSPSAVPESNTMALILFGIISLIVHKKYKYTFANKLNFTLYDNDKLITI